MILSKEATDCLLLQRSCLVGVPHDELIPRYLQSCKVSADIISNEIETAPRTAFDMGGGLGGVSVCLSKTWPECHFTVADYDYTDKTKRTCSYDITGTFAAYNSLSATKEMLDVNGVNGEVADLAAMPKTISRYDLIFSVLSWGFHYPVSTYAGWSALFGKTLIIDCRHGTGARYSLLKHWDNVELIMAYGKHEWFKCT